MRLPATSTNTLRLILIIAAAYAVTGRLGLALPYIGSNITLFWPPTGIAVAALFVYGARVWPGVAIGALLVNAWVGTPLGISAAIAIGNTLGPLVAAAALQRTRFQRTFDRPRNVLLFSGIIAAAMTLPPLGGVSVLCGTGALAWQNFGDAWLVWWLGDMVGALLVGPVLLSITGQQWDTIPSRRVEAGSLCVVALGCAWLLTSYTPLPSVTDVPLAFLSVVPLVWAAFRFGSLGTSIVALLLSVAAVWATASGHGQFSLADRREGLLLLWAYMTTICAIGLMITALQANRLRAMAELERSRTMLSLALSSGEMALFDWNVTTGEVFLDEQWRVILDESPAPTHTTLGELASLVHPDDVPRLRQPFLALLQVDDTYRVEHRVRTPGGSWVWIESNGRVVERDRSGRALRVIGTNKPITTRKAAEQALRASEERFAKAFQSNPSIMAISTVADGRYLDINEAYARATGYDRDEVIGRSAIALGIWADASGRDELRAMLERDGNVRDFEVRLRRKSGEVMTCLVSAEPIMLDGVACVLTTSVDITQRKRDEAAMRLASQVFATTVDAIVLTDADDRIIMVNSAFTKMTGFTADEMLGEKLAESPFRPIDPEQSAARMAIQRQQGFVAAEVLRYRKDGRELPLWVSASNVIDENGEIVNFVRVFTDISELKASQRQLQALAGNDALTGLPNRRVFDDRLEHAIHRTTRSDEGIALLFIDLDGFKPINDTYGHDVGDLVLKSVAERLQGCVRSSDSLCRLGGDEFVVIIEGADSANDAERVAARIVEACGRPFAIREHTLRLSASVGIAVRGVDGDDAASLLKSADRAMYTAKETKKKRVPTAPSERLCA
jgi:diguanylate cyclase (GGDEF)-like protein/PAS domain S-box-containing protein